MYKQIDITRYFGSSVRDSRKERLQRRRAVKLMGRVVLAREAALKRRRKLREEKKFRGTKCERYVQRVLESGKSRTLKNYLIGRPLDGFLKV